MVIKTCNNCRRLLITNKTNVCKTLFYFSFCYCHKTLTKTATWGGNFETLVNIQENTLQICTQANLMEAIFQLRFHLLR